MLVEKQTVWEQAAEALGWKYSPAYDGYIRPRTGDLDSELDAEDACDRDGIETVEQAERLTKRCTRCDGVGFYVERDLSYKTAVRHECTCWRSR